MNRHLKTGTIVATLAILLQLSACDSALDCLDSDGPEFDNDTISSPTLNQQYSDSIRASINNEPRDDRFSYHFKFNGQLPPGLQTSSQGRDFFIEGTATELGTYSFRLFVEVEDRVNANDSGLCFTSRSQDFQFTVQQQK